MSPTMAWIANTLHTMYNCEWAREETDEPTSDR
jgi:hypothetical protein